ncbi:ribonuclease HII [Tissierella praeacuta]|uniref:Ribonuclease HII n=1 Tax=Tissierella praeacuta DSM 18095 TaxID=1123404 RepID=A0A1M4SN22_9FIRM|nr:ribonuclease HII [Tissierella praeacuta]SHE33586.1 RNase HII [Tissierella praeacuta DSM 18095]SUP01585.1 Ribonuclease HII [Tissierella praeacuta]
MLEIENSIWKSGFNNIACIDEVGRGCLAGDVVACAIIMPKTSLVEGVRDSKKLSEKKREILYDQILSHCIAYGIGRVSSSIIDKINIKEATRLAMKIAVENLQDGDGNKVYPDFLLVDAENIDLEIPQESIIKGDDRSYGIGCASIIAKVFRDRLCLEWDREFEGYNLKKHKGYGTKEHIENIKTLGPSSIHRRSFLKKILK